MSRNRYSKDVRNKCIKMAKKYLINTVELIKNYYKC